MCHKPGPYVLRPEERDASIRIVRQRNMGLLQFREFLFHLGMMFP